MIPNAIMRVGDDAAILVSDVNSDVRNTQPIDMRFDSRFAGLRVVARGAIDVAINNTWYTYNYGFTLTRPPFLFYYQDTVVVYHNPTTGATGVVSTINGQLGQVYRRGLWSNFAFYKNSDQIYIQARVFTSYMQVRVKFDDFPTGTSSGLQYDPRYFYFALLESPSQG